MPWDRSSLFWHSIQKQGPFGAAQAMGRREHSWVGTRLRAASHDTLQRVVGLGLPETLDDTLDLSRPFTSPPPSVVDRTGVYELGETFRFLGRRYFRWSGRQLKIRADRMEELHQLARFFPVSQIVRSCHAQALHDNILPFDDLLQLPTYLHAFGSGNRMLQALVERGLAEGHMHLWGVTSAEEVWADHLLARQRMAPDEDESRRPDEDENSRHLRRVSRLLLRFLVFAFLNEAAARASVTRVHGGDEDGHGLPTSYHLERNLRRLDHLLVAPAGEERDWKLVELERWMNRQVERYLGSPTSRRLSLRLSEADVLRKVELDTLDYCLSPTTYPLFHGGRTLPRLAQPPRGHGSRLEGRARVLAWLHLVVHQRSLDPLPSRLPEEIRPWQKVAGAQTPRGQRTRPVSNLLQAVFFRYLACETYHHQRASLPGDRMGLEEFRRYYDSTHRRAMGRDRGEEMGNVLRRLLDEERIRVLEGRVTPSVRGDRTIRPWLVQYAERRRRRRRSRRPEDVSKGDEGQVPWDEDDRFGLVVHFLKQKEKPPPDTAISRVFNIPRRYGARQRLRREVLDLYGLLREPDPVVPFIVGIDAANVEYSGTPPEVFAPAFNFLRWEPIGQRPDSHLRRQLFYGDHVLEAGEAHHLALTFHTGEDFVAPLSGLRAIDEAIEFLHMMPGDRLGHAIALGVDPELWAQSIGYQILIPRQELLDTLVWTRQILGPGHNLIGELGIDDTIQSLASEIYRQRQEITPLTLHEAWLLRQFDPSLLPDPLLDSPNRTELDESGRGEHVGEADLWMQTASPELELRRDRVYTEEEERWWRIQGAILRQMQERVEPGRQPVNRPSVRARFLHFLYLYDVGVKRRGDEPITLDVKPGESWSQVILDVQARMQKKVHDRHLIVEVNPSSNVTIGPFETVSDLHIFQLAEEQEEVPVVLATVNTDDPGVFQTSLAHEFYLLGEAMLRRGDSESEVLQWLERLRRNGHDYSFLSDLRSLRSEHIDASCDEILELYSPRTHFERFWFGKNSLRELFL